MSDNLAILKREKLNQKQREHRRLYPEIHRMYEQTRYKKHREKRLLLSKIYSIKRKLKQLNIEYSDLDIQLFSFKGMSTYEYAVDQALKNHFHEYKFIKVRPEWLRNESGNRLELDFYCEELKVAIEVQGEQHYFPVSKFDRTEDSFQKRQHHDEIKRKTCKERGVVLVEFKYNDKIDEFINHMFDIVISKVEKEIDYEMFTLQQNLQKIEEEINKIFIEE